VSPHPILLLIASLALLAIEVIVVSFGVISLLAIGCGVGSVVLAFSESAIYGWSMVGALVVGAPVVLRSTFLILPKLPFARGLYLDSPDLTEEDRHAADHIDRSLLGQIGESVTPLRPAGTIMIGESPHDVVATSGTMIERGTRVRVVDITANRIVVEPLENEAKPN